MAAAIFAAFGTTLEYPSKSAVLFDRNRFVVCVVEGLLKFMNIEGGQSRQRRAADLAPGILGIKPNFLMVITLAQPSPTFQRGQHLLPGAASPRFLDCYSYNCKKKFGQHVDL